MSGGDLCTSAPRYSLNRRRTRARIRKCLARHPRGFPGGVLAMRGRTLGRTSAGIRMPLKNSFRISRCAVPTNSLPLGHGGHAPRARHGAADGDAARARAAVRASPGGVFGARHQFHGAIVEGRGADSARRPPHKRPKAQARLLVGRDRIRYRVAWSGRRAVAKSCLRRLVIAVTVVIIE
jgi:hypothetical protein